MRKVQLLEHLHRRATGPFKESRLRSAVFGISRQPSLMRQNDAPIVSGSSGAQFDDRAREVRGSEDVVASIVSYSTGREPA